MRAREELGTDVGDVVAKKELACCHALGVGAIGAAQACVFVRPLCNGLYQAS